MVTGRCRSWLRSSSSARATLSTQAHERPPGASAQQQIVNRLTAAVRPRGEVLRLSAPACYTVEDLASRDTPCVPSRPRLPAASCERQGPAADTTMWVGVLVVGGLLGAACLLTDQLRSGLTPLGQLVSPWVLVAAWAGSHARSWPHATALGGAALVAANVVYSVGGVIAAASLGRAVLWTVVALSVGPLAGIGGMTVRHGARQWQAPMLGLIATVAVAEAVVLWQHVRTERTVAVAVAVVVAGGCSILAEGGAAGRPGRAASVVLVVVAFLAFPASLVLEALLGAVGVITT